MHSTNKAHLACAPGPRLLCNLVHCRLQTRKFSMCPPSETAQIIESLVLATLLHAFQCYKEAFSKAPSNRNCFPKTLMHEECMNAPVGHTFGKFALKPFWSWLRSFILCRSAVMLVCASVLKIAQWIFYNAVVLQMSAAVPLMASLCFIRILCCIFKVLTFLLISLT